MLPICLIRLQSYEFPATFYKTYCRKSFSFPDLFVALLSETVSSYTIGGLTVFCIVMISCVGTAPTKEVHLIDSLNQVAYSYRYKDWTLLVMLPRKLMEK